MHLLRVSVALILVVAGCRTMSQMQETGFLNRRVRVGSNEYRYVVYVPDSFDARQRWPVVLFLHGAGERGSDGLKQTQVGLGAAIRMNPERFGRTIVVFPQAPEETRWLGEPARAAIAALDQTTAEFNGDRNRLYLTGISMGGYGTWSLAMEQPNRFAAIVPVCGGIVKPPTATSVRTLPIAEGVSNPYAVAASALPKIPIWLFHGSDDPVIPVAESRRMAEELRKLGAEVRYTEYPGVGHNSWDRAYAEPELWTWLVSQSR